MNSTALNHALSIASIIIYGVLSLIGLFAFAAVKGNAWGMGLAVAAALVTYLFQFSQFMLSDDRGDITLPGAGPILLVFVALAWLLSIMSFIITFTGV